ncbi:MAG TPA: MerR family transcriptional regulator, partial [Actinomycetes bacterium]|nr:MerR family transcriptional regulator [Actinomycetes bacterium]
MEEPRWTLDELAEQVDAALAVDYAGPPSGRVRAVPDRRAIRWYTTIGLIDRPVAHHGRTALYGPRHLLQLVAVKRLQAKGLPLAAIQQELASATDSQLARVAHLPSDAEQAAAGRTAAALPMPAGRPWEAAGRARRASFWREPPAVLSVATASAAEGTSVPSAAG